MRFMITQQCYNNQTTSMLQGELHESNMFGPMRQSTKQIKSSNTIELNITQHVDDKQNSLHDARKVKIECMICLIT